MNDILNDLQSRYEFLSGFRNGIIWFHHSLTYPEYLLAKYYLKPSPETVIEMINYKMDNLQLILASKLIPVFAKLFEALNEINPRGT